MHELSPLQREAQQLINDKLPKVLLENGFKVKYSKASTPALEFHYEPEGEGFEIYFTVEEDEYYFSCGSWHDNGEFLGADKAMSSTSRAVKGVDQLITLLNGDAYLEVKRAGRMQYRWTLFSAGFRMKMGLLFFPFWLKRSNLKLYNRVVDLKLDYNPWQ